MSSDVGAPAAILFADPALEVTMNRTAGLSIVTLLRELEYLDDAASRETLLASLSASEQERHQARRRSEDLKVRALLIREQMREFQHLFRSTAR